MVEWRGRLRGLVPSVLLLLSSLAASEILLTVLSWTSEDVAVLLSKERTRELQTRQIEDHELGNRGNPEFIEHDGRGFRNDHALEEVGFLFRSGRAGSAALSGPGGNPVDRPRPLRDVLSDHSRLYGLLRAVKDQIVSRHGAAILGRDFDEVVEGLSPRQRAFVSVFDDSQWRTVFTSRYRARVLDRNDPRIRVGFDILRQKLTEMRDSAENVGTAFLVVLLPTKEFVFQPRVERMSDHDSLADLVRSEKAFRDSLIGYLQAEGIGVVDPLDALRSSRRQPYFESGNGHPTALGHELIAAQVVAHIAADSLLERD